MHPATIQKRHRIWRKKIKVRNKTRKESWLPEIEPGKRERGRSDQMRRKRRFRA